MHSAASLAAIIGEDNRLEWYQEARPTLRAAARSTAVLLDDREALLESFSGGHRLTDKTATYGEADKLCRDEPFYHQPTPAFCTGFLVGPNLLATAGHCLKVPCQALTVVFDFVKESQVDSASTFAGRSVYHCERVEDQHHDEDWAILQLDRRVEGRDPLRLRSDGQAAIGTPLVMIGSPRGIPLKIAAGASVVPNQNSDEAIYFEADLDAFGGNSGSPVLNAQTLEVEGILVVAFGEFGDDQIGADAKTCRYLRRYPDAIEATPAWVTRATHFQKRIP